MWEGLGLGLVSDWKPNYRSRLGLGPEGLFYNPAIQDHPEANWTIRVHRVDNLVNFCSTNASYSIYFNGETFFNLSEWNAHGRKSELLCLVDHALNKLSFSIL